MGQFCWVRHVIYCCCPLVVGISYADKLGNCLERYTTSGERTPAEIQRNVGECLDRLQNEPLAREICNAEQNLPGNPAAYKPRDRKTFAACLKVLPRGKYAAQSRADLMACKTAEDHHGRGPPVKANS